MGIKFFNAKVKADDVEANDVIVLTEGCEGEVFPDPLVKIPLSMVDELDVVFVNCGGFARVASKYDEFCAAGLRDKLIPTFDQDVIEVNKEAGRHAWASPLRYLFYPCFEEEFPDWLLAKAVEKCEPHFPIPEDIITQARKGNRTGSDFYKAVERLGSQLHEGFRMPRKPDLTHALRDVLVHHYYVTPNIARWVDFIVTIGSKARKLNIPAKGSSMNWDLVNHLHLTGVLIYIGQSDGKLWFINFDTKQWESIELLAESAKPVIRPMWSQDGRMIAFTGKKDNSTVTAVLTMSDHFNEYIIDLGDPRRPTALSSYTQKTWHKIVD